MADMNGTLAPAAIRDFLFAGHATLTVVSKRTGTRFTYRVSYPKVDRQTNKPVKPEDATIHFVGVLTGPQNDTDYKYLGTIRNRADYAHGKKSSIGPDAPSAVAWAWFYKHVMAGTLSPALVDVYHEGRCGRCGRTLTVPESVTSGYGPECIGKVLHAA